MSEDGGFVMAMVFRFHHFLWSIYTVQCKRIRGCWIDKWTGKRSDRFRSRSIRLTPMTQTQLWTMCCRGNSVFTVHEPHRRLATTKLAPLI